jgi:gluconate 5-dehydrogenase
VQHREPLIQVSVADWQRLLDTNLTSAFIVGRAAARGMIERGYGKIINVCSVRTWLAGEAEYRGLCGVEGRPGDADPRT